MKVISFHLKKLKVSGKVVVLATPQFRESLNKDGFHTIMPTVRFDKLKLKFYLFYFFFLKEREVN